MQSALDAVLSATARPWAPFVVGFVLGILVLGYMFYETLYLKPPSLQEPWEYETRWETFVGRYKHYDWRYSVIVGTPVLLGVIAWGFWVILSVFAGVGV